MSAHSAENDAPVQCPTCGEYPYACSWMPGGCCSDCPHGNHNPCGDVPDLGVADYGPQGGRSVWPDLIPPERGQS